jgi:hypothetical protein
MIGVVAMAVAARASGCEAVASAIETNQLGPEGVARLFRMSARRDRGQVAAVVILAGSIARHAIERDCWRDKGERELALSMIERWRFAECDRIAVAIVRRHWGEIANARAVRPGPAQNVSASKHSTRRCRPQKALWPPWRGLLRCFGVRV